MASVNNKRKNVKIILLLLAIFYVTIIINLLPWQLVTYINKTDEWISIDFQILWILPLIFVTFKISRQKLKFKWPIVTLLICTITFGFLLSLINTFTFSQKRVYAKLYTNADNKNETIQIIHHHKFVKSWNRLYQIIKLPSGFYLYKKLEKININGKWLIEKGNPYHERDGLANFKNGSIIR